MRVNSPTPPVTTRTHEGAPAKVISSELELRRTALACLLWEDGFYESGKSIADRLAALVPMVAPEKVAAIAIEAREQMKLRHLPLLLVREMVRHPKHRLFVATTLERVIQRADELTEFLAIYWKDKKQPVAAQVKKGLARAFRKFNAYNLAKYNRDDAIKLRDVLFLTHAKPKDVEQAAVWKQLVDKTLASPDTWEVALSAAGAEGDKRAIWTRLLEEKKLGALALLRNLRNMQMAKVSDVLIRAALVEMDPERVLPFRFLASLRYAPQFAGELETAMLKSLDGTDKIPGLTVVLVDVSGSMNDALSSRSEMRRVDAAAGLAILARERCQSCRVFSFSDNLVEVPAFRGLALMSAIDRSQMHGSTQLGLAVSALNANVAYDRLVVITDEQSHDRVGGPKGKGFMINVATNQNGVGYGPWTHIDGWSERVLDYIVAAES